MTNPSGKAPPLNVPNWEVIYVEDFKVDCDRGEFLSKYGATTNAYKEGTPTSSPWKIGRYSPEILEVKNSQCIQNIGYRDGYPRVAALLPRLTPESHGVNHGRFSVCFMADILPGYKIAWLLWPDTGNWPEDGEIDFPECSLGPTNLINGFVHHQDAISGSDQWHVKSPTVIATDSHWHIATINWKSGLWRTAEVEFVLDGILLGKTIERIPNGPMHWVLQTEPFLRWLKPAVDVKGRIYIDWMVAYKWNK